MIRLVQHGEEDLGVRVDRLARILVMIVYLFDHRRTARIKERQNGGRVEEVFHEDRWELDEVRCTTGTRDVLVLRTADHS